LHGARHDRTQVNRYCILDDKGWPHLLALACSPAPEGHAHWTLQLLADRMAELGDARQPLPPQPGRLRPQDYEYRRTGTRNIFRAGEPLAGWRHVALTEGRTMQDFAGQMQWLVDEAYPDTPVIRVVRDNPVSRTGQVLNIRRMASLYETFPAAEPGVS
jgi:hypothetical protein